MQSGGNWVRNRGRDRVCTLAVPVLFSRKKNSGEGGPHTGGGQAHTLVRPLAVRALPWYHLRQETVTE